jgi:biotin transport system substrate-specific component
VTTILEKLRFSQVLPNSFLANTCAVVSGAVALSVLSQVSIPLYPVSITLQTFGVMLLGLFLTPKNAFFACLAYLSAATAGLPVLSAGHVNPLWILEPAAGYLLSFPFAAYLTSVCVRNSYLLSGIAIGQAVTFMMGVAWLSALIGVENAFWYGFVLFIPGTLLKSAAAYCVGKAKSL